ncbi:MAG: methyltransferase domain-containing protein [Planctomycetota bacterium]
MKAVSLWRRLFARFDRHAAPHNPPEQYWPDRGPRVVGPGGIAELRVGRQLATFQAIHAALVRRGATDVGDFGCNVAALGQQIFDWDYQGRYLGVENNPHALALAAQHLAEIAPARAWRLLRANIRRLPFADHALETVVMKDVLEHMEDFRPLLDEAARVGRRTLVLGVFLPWRDGRARVRRHRHGFYLNSYRRTDVLEFLHARGWHHSETIPTREADGVPNEVVTFTRDEHVI